MAASWTSMAETKVLTGFQWKYARPLRLPAPPWRGMHPKKHAIHAGSGDVGRSELSRVGTVRVRARTGVGNEDGMRACLAMCVEVLVQLRKANTLRIVWVHETIYQRTSQDAHDPAHVHRRGFVRLHILQ
eukprot:6212779-Pleurochrysis_carterae.AAC.2